MPIADAQIVYSGTQNIGCVLGGNTNRCYANINNAGGNDIEIHRNHAFGNQLIQIDEFPGGGFEVNGFHARVVGIYVYPYANVTGAVIGAGGPWGFQSGQANSLSEINGAYPNDAWTPLPNGETRYVGIRGTVGGATKYGWVQLTKNGFGNHTIVDWAYNNNTGQSIEAGQTSLPVELMSFDYEIERNEVKLFWRTASELDNAGFDIERSEDGANFRSIGWVDGHGNSSAERSYEFMDKDLSQGKAYYYRLRQVDFSGKKDYSKVITAKLGGGSVVVSELYPNPTNSAKKVSLDFTANKEGEWKASFFDVSGKAMNTGASLDFTLTKGDNRLNFDVSSLPSGIYFLKMEDGVERVYRKLVID
ncbi:MAG: T9SS type A sorting domain-containing protein [Saprospiraceae bacterium]|nr:T9SS type A sorting domain-containing protein [Saprospiraceae bacterium]